MSREAVTGHDLAKAWSEAPAFMPHGAGCACAGHVAIHLDPAAVEMDVLDYLADRYQAQGRRDLVELVADRRERRGVTFASWLGGLDTAPLAAESRACLMADLAATILSLAQTPGDGR